MGTEHINIHTEMLMCLFVYTRENVIVIDYSTIK